MTGQELYEAALDVAGIKLRNGAVPATASDLTARCVSLINILITENAFLNSLITKRPEAPKLISSLGESVELDRKLLTFSLPYGLAALLLIPDDLEESTLLFNKYIQATAKIRSELPTHRHSIEEVY